MAARLREAGDPAGADRVGAGAEDDRDGGGRLARCHRGRRRRRIDQLGPARHQHARRLRQRLGSVVAMGPLVDHGAPLDPAEPAHLVEERRQRHGLARGGARREYADAAQRSRLPLPLRLRLRPALHRKRDQPDPGGRGQGAEQATPALHSITSSARSSSDGGIVMPSALAVLRLMTSSNRVGCSMGRSAGRAPASMRDA